MSELTWDDSLNAAEWDAHLSHAGGHPLQSAFWGDARAGVDGIRDHRWAAFADGSPVLLARFEARPIGPIARAAWMPKGPSAHGRAGALGAFTALLSRLRASGFAICIDDPYVGWLRADAPSVPLSTPPRTAVVDLTVGRDRAWSAIDSQWRYGVRSAGRSGVLVEQSRGPGDIAAFFALCEQISERKGFDLPGSLPLVAALLDSPSSVAVEARLFVARFSGALVAGALVLRSGKSLHYFWGGVDRRFPKQRAGEAVQWGVMDWALDNGIERYDLEGIDPIANPGTYKFKIKMGASEVQLPGRRAYPLSSTGRVALTLGRWLGRL